MEVFALSGPSGTGKSTSALAFAYEKKIPAIIDDGLLIVNGKKVAGTSAKFEKNTITAVKCETFLNEQHAKEDQEAIEQFSDKRILIIRTSKKKVAKLLIMDCSSSTGKKQQAHRINMKKIRLPPSNVRHF